MNRNLVSTKVYTQDSYPECSVAVQISPKLKLEKQSSPFAIQEVWMQGVKNLKNSDTSETNYRLRWA